MVEMSYQREANVLGADYFERQGWHPPKEKMTKEDKQIIDRAVKEEWRIAELEKENELLKADVEFNAKQSTKKSQTVKKYQELVDEYSSEGADLQERIKELEKENAELEAQIEKMKCCPNCDFIFRDGNCYYDKECKNKDHWKLRR